MRADKVLKELGMSFELIEQDNPTKDCDDAARERGIETGQIVKSLIVETDDGFKHVCVPGDRKLSERKFGEHRMASPSRSRELTDQESGTVHPFASDLEHFFDERIFEHDRVSFTVGTTMEAVMIDTDELRRALDKAEFDYILEDLVVINDRDIDELVEKGATKAQAKFLATKGYRKIFIELVDSHEPKMVSKALEELEREDADFEKPDIRKLLNTAENETHLQRLVEEFAETGSITVENDGFDLEDVVEEVVAANPDAVDDYRSGQDSALNYLLGQVMQETQGRADGGAARNALTSHLD
jgi:prolyl-tRNA editing enzyme YbaK/EbsC (Cys-tRNA(Pro) deacylase)